MRSFEFVPRGPFDLAHQVQYFGLLRRSMKPGGAKQNRKG
jgi:hypothetical protein